MELGRLLVWFLTPAAAEQVKYGTSAFKYVVSFNYESLI
jgi:hypothetical protein